MKQRLETSFSLTTWSNGLDQCLRTVDIGCCPLFRCKESFLRVFLYCYAEEKMLSTKTSKSIRVKFTWMNLLRFFLIVRFPPVLLPVLGLWWFASRLGPALLFALGWALIQGLYKLFTWSLDKVLTELCHWIPIRNSKLKFSKMICFSK